MEAKEFIKKWCDTNGYRKDFSDIFSVNYRESNWVCATNAHELILMPEKYFQEIPTRKKISNNVEGILINLIKREEEFRIWIKTIEDAIPLIPFVDEFIPPIACSECDGTGVVGCNYGHYHVCNECDGKGYIEKRKPTGIKIPDITCNFNIDGANFQPQRLLHLKEIADFVACNEIILTHGDMDHANLFEIGDCFLILMPTFNSENIFYTFK